MATRFYLRRATSSVVGTTPPSVTASVSATAPTWTPGQTNSVVTTPLLTNYTLNDIISSVAQTSLAYTTDNVTTNQRQPLLRFMSPGLAAQTIAAQNLSFYLAGLQSNSNSGFYVALVLAVWRPSTGALVGRIVDGPTAGLSSGFAVSTTQTSFTYNITQAQTTAVTVQQGDVLVLELWRSAGVQGMATSYTNTLFYDGRTTPSNTDHAAAFDFTNDVAIYRPPVPSDTYGSAVYGESALRHYWRLDETSGPLIYDTKGTDDLSATGSTIQLGQSTAVALGNVGVNYPTGKSTDRIRGTSVDIGTSGPFSIEVWWYPTAAAIGYPARIIDTRNTTGFSGWSIGTINAINATTQGYIYDNTGGATTCGQSAVLLINTWHHIVMTYDGTALRYYVDGVQVGSATNGTFVASVDDIIGIGCAADTAEAESIRGLIDEVAWYNTALSLATIQQHYNLVKPGAIQGASSAGKGTSEATASKLSMPTTALAGPVDLFN